MKKPLAALLILSLASLLLLVGGIHFGSAQSTSESGIITQDTTWTASNSPYSFTGPVAVATGVTLTIAPGATVNLNYNYLEINGTLVAVGTPDNPVRINGVGISYSEGSIRFLAPSASWNQQTDSGSIIQNAVVQKATISFDNASPKLCDDTLTTVVVNGGSPVITHNSFTGGDNSVIYVSGSGAPIISDNKIPAGHDSSIDMIGDTGTPTIMNNQIGGGISVYSSTMIYNNTIGASSFNVNINAAILMYGGSCVIADNQITGEVSLGQGLPGPNGAYGSGYASVTNNIIKGYLSVGFATATVENNLIEDNANSPAVYVDNYALVKNNTVENNQIGFEVSNNEMPKLPDVFYNNIQDYSQNSVEWDLAANGNMTYNWWGTTDNQAISQSIHDSKDDFNLGTVTYAPILNAPNPEAYPNLNAPMPSFTPAPTPTSQASNTSPTSTAETPTTSSSASTTPQNPTATPQQPNRQTGTVFGFDWKTAAIIVLAVVAGLLVAVSTLLYRRVSKLTRRT